MSNLFRRAMVFTDLHLGKKSNSVTHNEDCWNFVNWMCKLAKQHDCETCLFLGDFHDNRNSVNVVTLDYSLRCLEYIAQHFSKTILIPGNHDLYYKDRRDAYSVNWSRNIQGIEIINDIQTIGDCVFVPWLVGDEPHQLLKQKGQYLFGHLELPNFLMNSMVRMPDLGEVCLQDLKNINTVFTGHFHKRQKQGNVWYMGNAFPHNFSDAGDDERGCMILEWGAEPQYHAWPDAPKYRVYNLSDVLDKTDQLLLPNSYVRINLDVDVSYEEASFVKESFAETYQLREISLLPKRQDAHTEDLAPGELKFESVDQIITSQISAITSEQYDTNILLDLYRNL